MQNFEAIREKVRQSVDLVDVVSEHVALKRSGKSFTGRCPFHSEKTPSFNVTPEMGIFKCFGCGVGGDVFKFVQLIEKVEFMDALRMLADRAGIEVQTAPRRSSKGPSRADLAKVNAWAARMFSRELHTGQQSQAAWAFLQNKGLSREMADRFGLGLALPDGDQLLRAAPSAAIEPELLVAAGLAAVGERGDRYDVFRDRLIFPIRDVMNRVVGFGGRALAEAKAKYVNTAQNALFDKGRNLYGLDLARRAMADARSAIVVEGYTDCMAAHQHGFDNTVATLGTALTEAHVGLLRRYCDEVVVVFDSDKAGEAAAERALAVALQHGLRVRLAGVPEGKDPCDYLQLAGAEDFRSVLKSGEDALGFKWQRTLERFQAEGGGSDRRAAMLEFVRFVAELGRYGAIDPIQRGLIVNEIARVVNAPAEEVQRMVARAGRPRVPRTHGGGEPTDGHVQVGRSCIAEDAEQAALITILEILLNEPGLWPAASSVFEPGRVSDPVLRRIAQRVRDSADGPGRIEVGELVSSVESTEEASRLTDLMFRGSARGDFEATLQSAVARLEQINAAQKARTVATDLCQAPDTGRDEEDKVLRELGKTYAQLASRNQVYPRRAADEYGAASNG